MSSVWKKDVLEWYTELPFDNWPRQSPTFSIQNMDCYFYFCRQYPLYPNNCYTYDLYLKPKTTESKLASFSLDIYSDYNTPGSFTRTSTTFSTWDSYIYRFYESHISNKGSALGRGYFVRFCCIFNDKLPIENDKLLLRLENETDDKSTEANLMLSLRADVDELSLNLGELLKKGDYTDVQLLCNGGNIPAHRAILAARSKVFSDMLQQSTEESKNGLINLITTEKTVMELCLEFIYRGKIINMPIEKATDLYVLGYVLKIPSLVKLCTDLMISKVHDDNYISYLILAHKYDDDYFKCGLTDYISDNIALLKSESWMKFTDEYMKTAIEVYKKCMFKLI